MGFSSEVGIEKRGELLINRPGRSCRKKGRGLTRKVTTTDLGGLTCQRGEVAPTLKEVQVQSVRQQHAEPLTWCQTTAQAWLSVTYSGTGRFFQQTVGHLL